MHIHQRMLVDLHNVRKGAKQKGARQKLMEEQLQEECRLNSTEGHCCTWANTLSLAHTLITLWVSCPSTLAWRTKRNDPWFHWGTERSWTQPVSTYHPPSSLQPLLLPSFLLSSPLSSSLLVLNASSALCSLTSDPDPDPDRLSICVGVDTLTWSGLCEFKHFGHRFAKSVQVISYLQQLAVTWEASAPSMAHKWSTGQHLSPVSEPTV